MNKLMSIDDKIDLGELPEGLTKEQYYRNLSSLADKFNCTIDAVLFAKNEYGCVSMNDFEIYFESSKYNF